MELHLTNFILPCDPFQKLLLQATFAAFEDKRVEEMRIGIGAAGNDDDVIEGVVWRLLGDEGERAQEEIAAAPPRLNVNKVTAHAHRFPLEYCDD